MMKKAFIVTLSILLSGILYAQEEADELLPEEPAGYKLKLQVYRYAKPELESGDTV
jgi:hypothetical protein